MKRAWIIPFMLLVAILSYAGYIPVQVFKAGTGLSVAFTDTTVTYSLSAGTQRDIEFYLYAGKNFSGAAAETVWFYNARNYYARPQTLSSTPDRFKMQMEWGTTGQDDYGPTTFDTARAISTDSALVFALCRLNTQPGGTYRLLTFKRAVNTGMSYGRVTTGGNVLHEAQDIDNSNFPDSGNTTHMQLFVRTKYP